MKFVCRLLICVLLAQLIRPHPSSALTPQDTIPSLPDSAQAVEPEAPADSVPPVSIATYESEVPTGPLPPGTRYVFTRDSMLWSSAITLADLLGSIPGVYIARGGFLGQPEFVMYGGRGPAGVEVYWDDFLMYPVGADTVYVDLGRISLSYLQRVDVEVLPALLRVFLVSERHDRIETRSVFRIMSGAFSSAEFMGMFQKRWPSGLGLNLVGDFVASEGEPASNRNDQTLDMWAKFEWLPSQRYGASYQIRRQRHERDLRPGEGIPEGVPARDGARTDFLFKFFAATGEDRMGLRFEGGLGSTAWTGDSITGEQRMRQAFARLRYARPTWHAQVRARMGDQRISDEIEARVGWRPLDGLVLSGYGRSTTHSGDRNAHAAGASAGLYRGPFSLVGQISSAEVVQAPAIADDSAQAVTDQSLSLGLETGRLGGHIGLVRRDVFLPFAPPDFIGLPEFGISEAADYVVADLRVEPLHSLVLDAWYSHPRTKPPDLQPPQHGRAALTLRSKFWRTFRSGAFDLMLRYAIEYWSRGTAGMDESGEPILLPGLTYHEFFIQFELAGFVAFWNLRNARNVQAQYVPFLPYPRNAQTFGVTWQFGC